MADRFELSYVYARVCGALGRSWIGERSERLLAANRLPELWRTLFGDAPPALPETALVAATEARVVSQALLDFEALAASLRREEPFFLALRRKAEFARIKRILLAVRDSEPLCPPCDDPHLPEGFRSVAYPGLAAMFGKGRYSWIDRESLADLPAAENRLDRQYYTELWEALGSVPRGLRDGLRGLLSLEIELANVVWALRLARYYSMRPELIAALLVSLPAVDLGSAALAGAALRQDRRQDWAGWKYEGLLQGGGEGWRLDVPSVETEARRLLYRRLRLALHLHPISYAPLYCFFKIKEFEVAVVLGLVEGLHLGAPADELADFALSRRGR
jgi:hypothetical protein